MANLGIRGKLILIFVLIKVLPLMALAWFAWVQVAGLGQTVTKRTAELSEQTKAMVGEVGSLATRDSITALDIKSREAIERLTTDTARQVAAFLYARDENILQAARLPVDQHAYAQFLAPLKRPIILHAPWELDDVSDTWKPAVDSPPMPIHITATNDYNAKEFHARLPEKPGSVDLRPLYHEMTFVDLDGMERIKVSPSKLLSRTLRDVSQKTNTFLGAESYFPALKKLAPGEIYVSEVIGEYIPGKLIGPYTKAQAAKAGIAFKPEESGYAGKENPVGKRFEGIIRWATPVVGEGKIIGYVTLALDHSHVMEFTDHVIPTEERYSPISDASSGNYAFMWDYKGRNISHPRDYFIVGYNAATGKPAVPWMDAELYEQFVATGEDIEQFQLNAPTFYEQSLKKKPAAELIKKGLVALDGRYLNFAPQCTGWHNLTREGGSGSFVIFWSGLWKLTTAAAIPYRTGIYGKHPRGFGYVTIGANVHEFHRAATETAEKIDVMVAGYEQELDKQDRETQSSLAETLQATAEKLSLSTAVMVFVVILIAIWMASTLTRKITSMIAGIRRFQKGNLDARLDAESSDEIGQLATAFNDMSDSVQSAFKNLTQAEARYRNIVEHATAGIFQSTLKGRFISVNPALAAMLRYDSAEQMMHEIKDIGSQFYVNQDYRPEIMAALLKEGEIVEEEFQAKRRDGTKGSFTSNTRLVLDQHGNPDYLEGMILDISDRKDKEQAERQIKMAEAANLAKSEFLARMSHEIRTPMNAVIGVADLLEEYDLDKEQETLVRLLKSSGDNLLSLIDDILDLSKIEAGKLIMEEAVFDLREEIATLCSLLANRAYEKNLEFDYDIMPAVPRIVRGDMPRIRQILTNLIGNAIKFTSKGEITLTVDVQEEKTGTIILQFKIRDTGIGIPTDMLSAIFESFGQVDSSTTRKFGGTGLGLAICKNLVELMQGEISATSVLGEGSTFSFTLPLRKVKDNFIDHQATMLALEGLTILVVDNHAMGRQRLSRTLTQRGAKVVETKSGLNTIETVRSMSQTNSHFDIAFVDTDLEDMDGFQVAQDLIDQKGRNQHIFVLVTANNLLKKGALLKTMNIAGYLIKPINESVLISTLQSYQNTQQKEEHDKAAVQPIDLSKHILVVDDAKDNRLIMDQYLKKTGYKYTLADSGLSALNHYQMDTFDIVFMDMQMPDMDGYTTIDRMRKMEREGLAKPTVIIALTAHTMVDDRQKCLNAGCDDYMAKPIRKASLLEMLRKHLSS